MSHCTTLFSPSLCGWWCGFLFFSGFYLLFFLLRVVEEELGGGCPGPFNRAISLRLLPLFSTTTTGFLAVSVVQSNPSGLDLHPYDCYFLKSRDSSTLALAQGIGCL
ncbi:uncharacterized protein BO95DRAFT_438057, partial [Aspergillus brunneoviolaceus CBS 621.78]